MARRDDRTPDDPPANHALAGLRALRAGLPDGPAPAEEGEAGTDSAPERRAGSDRLIVRRERKGHGGKTATRVEGLVLEVGARKDFAREVKRALGVGARWESDDLVVQGGEIERVAKWFEGRGHRVTRGTR